MMSSDQRLSEIKERITTCIRRNSDHGFLPYRGCDQVCMEMFAIFEEAEQFEDQKLAFDIRILVLLRMMKIISYADTSSGMATDVIRLCLAAIEKRCQDAAEIHHQYFFDTIVGNYRLQPGIPWLAVAASICFSHGEYVK